LIGALGARRALKGFVGRVPERIAVGDVIHILNLGGVMGVASAGAYELGRPIEAEVLGMAAGDDGEIRNVAEDALPRARRLACATPVVLVGGTCMNSGKTLAACEIVRRLGERGLAVAAMKATGVACLRDAFAFTDHGALQALTFLDCGVPSTAGADDT